MAAPVVVVGPTASGKSDVAMAAARAVAGTEIVAVDAMQVYRGMDIGTAKPTAADRAAVRTTGSTWPTRRTTSRSATTEPPMTRRSPASPGARCWSPGPVSTSPRSSIASTSPAGGRRSGPSSSPTSDLTALHRRLAELDPVAAARIEPGNRRRVVRALEVVLGSGRPFSSYGPGLQAYPPTHATLIGLRWSRSALAERISRRVGTMMDAGLLAEVERVRGGRHVADRPSGARIQGARSSTSTAGRRCADAVSSIVVRTRQFAVRQERWFRRDPRIRWVDVDRDPVAEVLPIVIDALTTCPA